MEKPDVPFISSVLVTGGAGYMGGSFCAMMKNRVAPHKIVIIDTMENGWYKDSDSYIFYKGDVRDYDLVTKILTKHSIKIVFHFAAYLKVGESVQKPLKYYDNNLIGGIQLIKACVACGVENFIFSSSCASFGEPQYLPIDEKHPQIPINPYGRSKLMIENILEDTSLINPSFKYVNLRYFNIAGALPELGVGPIHFPEALLISCILEGIMGKKPHFQINGKDFNTHDGTCVRDYVHVYDLAEAHYLAYQYLRKIGKNDSFNLGSGNGYSNKEVVDKCIEISQKPLNYAWGPRRAGDPSTLIASSEKAIQTLGWKPIKTLDDCISDSWKWWIKRDEVIEKVYGFNPLKMVNCFNEKFPNNKDLLPYKTYFAPGRINLIGEHTDYSGGYVLPASVNRGTYILGRQNNSELVNFYSMNYGGAILSIDLSKEPTKGKDWENFLLGAVYVLQKSGLAMKKGADFVIFGNLPMGSGLSSSASICVAALLALTGIQGKPIPENGSKEMTEIALLAKQIENEFIGVSCGLMDQFISANGKGDKAIFLSCLKNEFSYVPLKLEGHSIVICDTKLPRQLVESKYNERFEESKECLKIIQSTQNIESLSCLTENCLSNLESLFKEKPVLWKRITHIVKENDRVKKVFKILQLNQNTDEIFDLINKSGDSLKNDYESTGKIMDEMVDALRSAPGVVASRAMGGGFGGCALAIIKNESIACAKELVTSKYFEKTQIKPEFYEFDICDGAQEIVLAQY